MEPGTSRTRSDGHWHQVGSFSVACHEACGLAKRHCRLPRLWRPRVALAGCVTWHPGGALRKTQGSLCCDWAHAPLNGHLCFAFD